MERRTLMMIAAAGGVAAVALIGLWRTLGIPPANPLGDGGSPAAPGADTYQILVAGGEFAAGGGYAAGASPGERLAALLSKNAAPRTFEARTVKITNAGESVISSATANCIISFVEPPPRARADAGAAPGKTYQIATPQWARARDALALELGAALAKNPGPPLAAADADRIVTQNTKSAAACAARGAKYIVTIVPELLESDSELRALAVASVAEPPSSAPAAQYLFNHSAALAERLRNANLTVIDLAPAFREGADVRRMLLIDCDAGRWNAAAANIAAAQIATHLIASNAASK